MRNKPLEITLTIDQIGAGGDGVGAYNGKSVYIAKTAPGESVRVRLENENAEGFTGRLLSIDTPGFERVNAPCPHFSRCGGCALQHVREKFYRNWKTEKVKSALQRANVSVAQEEGPVFLQAATRRRTTLAVFKNGNDIRFGYNEPRTRNILDIKTCLILEPALAEKIQALRPYLPALVPARKTVDLMLQYADGAFDMVLSGPWRTKGEFTLEQLETFADMTEKLDIARISVREKEFSMPETMFTRRPVIKRFGALNVALPPGAFLQASVAGEEVLTRIVAGHIGNNSSVVDLFSGCGTFTGTLLEKGMQAHAVDGDAEAIKALAATRHPKLTTARRNLFKEPLSVKDLQKFDAAVFDPPRAGAKAQAEILAQSNISRIIGVSCNPASFARDARILQNGGYSLQSLTMIDQFVWSAHVEIIGLFLKK